ncbi:hypothetical protein BDY21DRAFT_60287 [Lineolata rhizophorae]|uniref:Uncharacterized protein n=1 Tax=Lineolata rhizophorae TaxID=578093 RepID=A0A6A6NWW7_9PEZI|nr:hypothetical protein BDY21DRAFT_60287 [Lineolata rhizophorae]
MMVGGIQVWTGGLGTAPRSEASATRGAPPSKRMVRCFLLPTDGRAGRRLTGPRPSREPKTPPTSLLFTAGFLLPTYLHTTYTMRWRGVESEIDRLVKEAGCKWLGGQPYRSAHLACHVRSTYGSCVSAFQATYLGDRSLGTGRANDPAGCGG